MFILDPESSRLHSSRRLSQSARLRREAYCSVSAAQNLASRLVSPAAMGFRVVTHNFLLRTTANVSMIKVTFKH